MATRTNPLMTVAALATAATVAVATPALAPSITTATPPALSSAKVELATFADLLSIPGSEWNNAYFNGWGGAIGPINVEDPDTYDYWLPYCNYDCTIPGVSGIAYLALDALINGNGNGINEASLWGVSAVNYFFEGGAAIGVQYLVERPFVTEGSPLYNPAIGNLIALAFQGPYALTTLYVTALSTVAQLASNVPFIGEYLYRGIGSYIGPAFQTVDNVYDYSDYAGISGILRYIGGVITTGGNPNPYPLLQDPAPVASTAALAAKAPAALSVADAPAASSAATAATETASSAVTDTPAAPVAETKVEAASTESNSTPAESASPTASTASSTTSETKPADTASTTAADAVAAAPAATAPATKPAASPAPSRKRPVRSAAAGVAKAVTSAVSGAVSAATGSSAGAGSSAGGASAAN